MKLLRKPNIQPMAGKVVINPEPLEHTTEGGLILLESSNPSNFQRGAVVALGSPLPGVPIQMKYMDTVLFPKGTGIPYDQGEGEYLLMNQDELIAVL